MLAMVLLCLAVGAVIVGCVAVGGVSFGAQLAVLLILPLVVVDQQAGLIDWGLVHPRQLQGLPVALLLLDHGV